MADYNEWKRRNEENENEEVDNYEGVRIQGKTTVFSNEKPGFCPQGERSQ